MRPDPLSSRPGPAPGGERALLVCLAALFFHAVLFRGSHPVWWFDRIEAAVWLDEPLRVLDGDVMYRDFFQFLGPGIVYLNAGLLGVFGRDLAVLGLAAMVMGALGVGLLHAHAALLAGPGWRLLPPLAFASLAFAPNNLIGHKVPALLLGLGALLALVRGRRGAAAGFAAGVLLGVATLFAQDFGAGAAAGTLVWLAQGRHGRALVACAVGLVLAVLGGLSYFVRPAGLQTLLEQWLLFPLVGYRNANPFVVAIANPAVPLPLRSPRFLAQTALGVAALFAALRVLKWSGGAVAHSDLSDQLRLSVCAGLGVFAATLHRGLYPSLLPLQCLYLLGPLSFVLQRAWERAGDPRRLSVLGLVAILALGQIWAALGALRHHLLPSALVRESHRSGTVWMRTSRPELFWIEERTRRGERVFLLPELGGAYFLTDTRPALPFSYFQEGQMTLDQARSALTAIERVRPRVGVWSGVSSTKDPAVRLLEEGLGRRYTSEPLPSGALLMTRR